MTVIACRHVDYVTQTYLTKQCPSFGKELYNYCETRWQTT